MFFEVIKKEKMNFTKLKDSLSQIAKGGYKKEIRFESHEIIKRNPRGSI